jgi:hypothetical protein
MAARETLLRVLDLARWAPSGDNTQPWRFEIVSADHIAVHGHDTREWCLYDFDGHASHMAHGALLETLRIGATGFGLEATWTLREGCPETAPVYDVKLRETPGITSDPFFPYIETRVVQRRPMRTTPLTDTQRQSLTQAIGSGYELRFLEPFAVRRNVAGLLWDNAYIRLTCPEAYVVHREIIEWGARFSQDRIPEQAVGVDPLTAGLMKWVMQRWSRVQFFNKYLLGTIPPRIQLDLLPGLCCAAHVLLLPGGRLERVEDFVRAGIAMQRLWLCATSLGLYLQPEMTPIIFRWYVRAGRTFSDMPALAERARRLASRFEDLAEVDEGRPMAFFCRVGRATAPGARSVRKDLEDLLI